LQALLPELQLPAAPLRPLLQGDQSDGDCAPENAGLAAA
jgi:hypothetical protein